MSQMGTTQVQCCRKKHLTLNCAKVLLLESSSQRKGTTSYGDSNVPKKGSEERNVRSDERNFPERNRTKIFGSPCGRLTELVKCDERHPLVQRIDVSGCQNYKKMFEDKDKFYNNNESSIVPSSSSASVQQLVLKSLQHKGYLRFAHSQYISQTNCAGPEDYTTSEKSANKCQVPCATDEFKTGKSKVAQVPVNLSKVNDGMLSKTWDQTAVKSSARCGQTLARTTNVRKITDDTAKFTTENVPHLKTQKSECIPLNNVETPQIIASPIITNPASSDTTKVCDSRMGVVAVEKLPLVPEHPCYDDNCGCNVSNHPKDCCCTLRICSTNDTANGTSCPKALESEVNYLNNKTVINDTSRDAKSLEVGEVGVQTSFTSVHQPCSPAFCPKGKRTIIVNPLISKVVQTERNILGNSKIELSTVSLASKKILNTQVKLTIPPRRSKAMDDRLLRRMIYFDSNPSSVCNKDVEFCTYRIHRSKKTMGPHNYASIAQGCVNRKAKNALYERHLVCNEILIEVATLELSTQVVSQLLKTSHFVYVDYVFLGHIGNETHLAPISTFITFDSRLSHCVSMQFNRKERSILREQINPTGLLAKDIVMFILVVHAAPEYDMLKNWDFAYGYLSMRSLLEKDENAENSKLEIDMIKIGSTVRIGTLTVIVEGLQLLKTIRDEDIECVQQRPELVLSKLTVTKIKEIENNQ